MAKNSSANKSVNSLVLKRPSINYSFDYPREGGAYEWPKDIHLSSKLILNKETLKEANEFLQKAHYMKNLWQPDREVGDVKKALEFAQKQDELRQQREVAEQI